MIAAAAMTAEVGAPSAGVPATPVEWLVAFALITLGSLRLRGAYRQRLRLQVLDDLRIVVVATALAAMAVIALRVIFADDSWAAAETLRLWLFSTIYLSAGRAGLFWAQTRARRQGEADLSTLIVGAGRVGQLAARRLLEHPEYGLYPIGFLDKEPLGDGPELSGLPVLGASWDLDRVVAEHGVEHVIVTFSTAPHGVLLRLVRRCEELGIAVSHVPRLFERLTDRITVEHLGGLPLVTVEHADPRGWEFAVKYALDRVVAAVLLVLVSPLIAVAALAIRITMGRPILFRQRRVGRDGHLFEILKLKTMDGTPESDGEADVDWAALQLGLGGDAAASDWPDDDRATRVGRVLRTLALDELPQLWNVLRGDMSLVGPRPERVAYVRLFEEGITGYRDRHRVNYYIENWSLWLDVKILLLTVRAVFRSA